MDIEAFSGAIVKLLKMAVTQLPPDVENALKEAKENENEPAKTQITAILENVKLANREKPICQDTGIQTFFVKMGIDFPFKKIVREGIIEGVRRATKEIPLRPNAIDVFSSKNSGDNTGKHVPFIHWEIVDGSSCEITALPKGGGSENMSTLRMLKPGEGLEGVKKFVIEWMVQAAGNPCPPTVVGVGIGGGADIAMKLAKQAILRPVGERSKDVEVAKMEEELMEEINKTGIGPMGLGGKTTVLDVHVEVAHRHPASLPVGIVVQCWADRRAKMIIDERGEIVWSMK
ncbi:MAG: fumarate hydratase [Thermoplasmata archaeon]|nr:MAG: fumarate hydratase [Thermoplasmata archaeon]